MIKLLYRNRITSTSIEYEIKSLKTESWPNPDRTNWICYAITAEGWMKRWIEDVFKNIPTTRLSKVVWKNEMADFIDSNMKMVEITKAIAEYYEDSR